jgi:MFS family permease
LNHPENPPQILAPPEGREAVSAHAPDHDHTVDTADEHGAFNFFVNLADGSFFGLALGFASFVTIIPLFVGNFTTSAVLIGLIPAIHTLGWQLPQIITAHRLSRMGEFKSFLLRITFLERLPFLGLALIAWLAPQISTRWVLIITYALLIWQGLAGGLAANPWQSMIAKVIPASRQGTFFGLQGGLANALSGLGAIIAGAMLVQATETRQYALPFSLAFVAMMASFFFLSLTKEKPHLVNYRLHQNGYIRYLLDIARRDRDFMLFVLVRNLLQFSLLGLNFYAIYVALTFQASLLEIGLMNGIFAVVQIFANPLLGIISDRFGFRLSLMLGAFSALLSTLIALGGRQTSWFYLSFGLAGVANVAMWTVVIAMTLKFGALEDRPAYIGLSHTLTAPSTLLAPLLGGWIADTRGYSATFVFTLIFGLIALLTIYLLHEPGGKAKPILRARRLV